MKHRLPLLAAALHGFCAVAMGAFAAHGLRATLPPEALAWVQTGAQYQAVHAAVLVALAVWIHRDAPRGVAAAQVAMATGTLLFSGSLYAMALSGWRGLALATPVGGTLMLLGWALLAWTAVARRKD
jgi:uncharacterized membrane protein YgdD (TMEM256/DUF423 family)